MEIFLTYVKVFAVGGIVCSVGQLLINKTNMTSARILVLYMLLGVVLEISGAFTPMKDFAGSGVTIPIMGFGSSLTKGALEGVKQFGLLGALTGGLSAVA
ncbi:MAG: SpoVA/SpoVAEb family sporulation membrane protein, partial [Clostridia bacterium]